MMGSKTTMQLRNAPKIIPLFLVVYAVLTVSTSVHQTKAQAPDVLLPLSWERSRENDTIDAGAVGAGVEAGLTLATFPEAVWDNGVFTPIENRLNVPPECDWASWPHRYAVDVRHFRATFSFPDGLDPASPEGLLYDPCYGDDLVPINDNLYVFINGVEQFRGGTDYGALNGGYQGTSPLANETDGWYVPGGIRIDGFQAGENVLDIVTEERAQWGGLGYLELRLVPRLPPTEITVTLEVPQTLTLNQDGWYAENPTELRATVTNNTEETFSGDLEITFSDSSRLVFGEGDEFLEHPNRLTHHIDSLAAGESLPQEWKLWVQPMDAQTIEFSARAFNDTGALVGPDTASMSVPTASIHPVVILPGWPGSFKNFNGEWEIDPIKKTYNNLLEELQLAGYEKDVSLFTFPYDWRQDANKNADELSQKIPEFLAQTAAAGKDYVNASKVDLVGHSGGGLVSRAYIQGSNYGDNVHRLITLGTPHRGTPKAYLAAEGLEFDFLDDIGVGGPILARWMILSLASKNHYCTFIGPICLTTPRDIHRFIEEEVPSVRQAFPTDDYLKDDPGGYLVSVDDPGYEYPFGHQVNGFLNSLNDDIVILIDRLGVNNVIAVVGDRHQNQLPLEDTDKLFRVMDRSLIDRLFGLWSNGKVKKDEEFRPKGRGDKTVPQDSANLGIVDGQVQTKVKISSDNDSIIEHGRMPTQLQQSIVEYLTKTHPFFDAGFIDPETNWKNALIVGNLSPVEIQVTDPLGRRSGLDFLTGNEFTEIPGAFFSRSDIPNESDFVFIPDALNGEYRINLKGINEGNYRVVIQALGERDILTLAEFSGSTSAIQEHEHLVQYDSETVPETPLTLEWLPPLENPDETLHVSKERILPIKFTIKDARGDFVADESIIVWIVDPDELSEAKAAFTSLSPGYHGKSDVLRINVQEKLYIVNLHLSDYDFIPGRTYVVGVTAFGEQLGITGVSVKDD